MIRVPNPRIVGAWAGAFPGAALVVALIVAWLLWAPTTFDDDPRPPTECVAVAEIPDYSTVVTGQVETCRPVTTEAP